MIKINLLPVRAAAKMESLRKHVTIAVLILVFFSIIGAWLDMGKRGEIEALKASILKTQQDVEGLKKIIEQVNNISQTIVSAVEEQSVTTNEIAKNIGGSGQAANEISHNITEISNALNEFQLSIQKFCGLTTDTYSGASRTRESAKDMAELSSGLKRLIERFTR